MSKGSLIYRNIHWYRFVMGLLYGGSYRERFRPVMDLIVKEGGRTVTEFCFGDVILAEYCKSQGVRWTGFDLNPAFVSYARSMGYDAFEADVLHLSEFPQSDMGIIAGSLYHFNPGELKVFLKKVFLSTRTLVISEPVQNLSSGGGPIAFLARSSSRTVREERSFRYNRESLLGTLNMLGKELSFTPEIITSFKKDLIIILRKI